MDRLNLYFPQWQGSGTTNDIYNGAFLIRKELETEIPFVEIMQPNASDYLGIQKNIATASGLLQNLKPNKIFTVGGDCGIEISPISYLTKLYNSNLNILWLDDDNATLHQIQGEIVYEPTTINKTNLYVHMNLSFVNISKLKDIYLQLKTKYSIVGVGLVEYAPKTKRMDEEVAELAKIIFL